MIVAGIDVGHRTTKLVILRDGDIIAGRVIANSDESSVTAQRIIDQTTGEIKIAPEDISFIVATGSMGKGVKFANLYRTSMACLARGVHEACPSARTVIDLGGETCNIIKINPDGAILDIQSNDKCAAGTGIFFESIARLLGLSIGDMGALAAQGQKTFSINSMCVVFAEQEVISQAHENPDISAADLAASFHASVAEGVAGLAKRLTLENDIALTGGCAINPGYVKYVSVALGSDVKMPEDPQLVTAYGAALSAAEKGRK
jgi:benzoyl-CoA reductase subunit D